MGFDGNFLGEAGSELGQLELAEFQMRREASEMGEQRKVEIREKLNKTIEALVRVGRKADDFSLVRLREEQDEVSKNPDRSDSYYEALDRLLRPFDEITQ